MPDEKRCWRQVKAYFPINESKKAKSKKSTLHVPPKRVIDQFDMTMSIGITKIKLI